MDLFHRHSKPKIEDTPGIKVKICGIRHLHTAEIAVHEGADYLGFNFVNSSHRYISPVQAKEIIHHVKHKTNIVGVFQNMPVHEVNELIGYLNLDAVQLHGHEDQGYIQKVKSHVIKAVTLPNDYEVEQTITALKNYNAHNILIDREHQGEGEVVDLQKAMHITHALPTFLAGGLHPGNVADAIIHTNPFGVDVAGGIETNGFPDVQKIAEFIKQAKGIQK